MFYTFASFASAASDGAPVQAVPKLESLKFLSSQPEDKLAVIRVRDWRWDEQQNTVFILPEDVIEVETVSESEVRVLQHLLPTRQPACRSFTGAATPKGE
jgi:hypothetical protein